ncbi:hypothetical protein IWW38_001291 [Coemansia aciculifera]|uniref:Uncharacterized protein n=1 Tax=Coemansia aciculifera TaxID=417176 RepID=A0ACC1M7L3_9FUNG|nr:hypothetical protein IWW38_001291 [Coemansia aciculifera]
MPSAAKDDSHDDTNATASDIEPCALPDRTGWQNGRAQRVRALEAALEAATSRQTQAKKKPPHSGQDPDYGTMLHSDSDSDSDSETRGADPDSDAASCTSSVLYSEGQPLLCTYQPPASLGASAAPSSSYGLLRPAAPVKTPETYLSWDLRLRSSLQRVCAIGCCCSGSPEN